MGVRWMRRAACLGAVALGMSGLASCDLFDPSEQLLVTTTLDGGDADPGDGTCEVTVGAGDCSLRAAIDEVNENADILYVEVPAGTYVLSGDGDDTNASGDLDVDPASGHVIIGAPELGVVIDAQSGAGGLDARGGIVVTWGLSVSGSSGAGFTAASGAALSVLAGSPHANAGAGVHFAAGSTGQVLSSTVSGNGAGVVVDGDAWVTSSTITDNGGPGLSGSGTASVVGSIVVGQASAPDCAAPVATQGWNAFGDGACGGGFTDVLAPGLNLVPQVVAGVPAFVPGAGSATVRDAIPLTAGRCSVGAIIDQAGTARPVGTGCDMGAVEGAASPIVLVVDTAIDAHDADTTDGVCDDGTGACPLRAAIDEANAQGGATATHFDPVTITIADGITPVLTLYSEDPLSEWDSDPIIISGGVTIEGGGGTIDMGQKDRGFEVRHQYLELRDVSIVNADLTTTGMVSNTPAGDRSGASITLDHALVGSEPLEFGSGWNSVVMSGGDFTMVDSSIGNVEAHAFRGSDLGSVRIERSTVMGSEFGISATAHDIVIRDAEVNGALLTGLAVDPTGHILIERSLIQSSIRFGLTGPFTIRNSTYSGNRGPLIVRGPGTIELSTFADNSRWSGYNDDWNDLWVLEGTVTVSGSVLGAGLIDLSNPPTDYPACATDGTGTLVSGGYNVVVDTSCGLAATGDVQGVDPLLTPLGDNGGRTSTQLPDAGSPAIDRIPVGTPGLCDGTLPTDQRGKVRPLGDACDAGAVEAQSPIALVVDSAIDAPDADTSDGTCDDGSGACTLRAAFQEANVQGGASPTDFDPVVITIAPGIDPVLDPAVGTDAPLVLGGAVIIDGGGATIDLGGKARNIEVRYKLLTVHDVTITGAGGGPAITNVTPDGTGAPIALDGATLSGNGGDGVAVGGGLLAITGSRIEGSGGAAISGTASVATIATTTLADNHADVVLAGTYLQVLESRFTGSELGSTLASASIYLMGSTVDDTGGVTSSGILHVEDSTLTGNDHGITSSRFVELTESTVADNNRSGATGTNAHEIRLLGTAQLRTQRSIIASTGYQACRPGASGRVTTFGSNLATDTSCRLTHPLDRPSVAPLLGPLADNGGATPTRMTLTGSPAVDAVPLSPTGNCSGVDQRGVTRPQGAGCDIGAVER